MKVCLICEGSYPYVAGGVAGWVQTLCKHFRDVEFVMWAIATTREEMGEYRYKIPANVKEIRTIYLGEDRFVSTARQVRLLKPEKEVLKSLITGRDSLVDWKEILKFIRKYKHRLVDLLMGEAFFEICLEEYRRSESREAFLPYLWNFRGMYFPLMNILAGETVKADLYHALSTGYAGILGSCASYTEGKPLILSEHGIYTREREEDIIRSDLLEGGFKELWIRFFKKISTITYQQADVVTCLFEVNKTLQIELGCPEEKIRLIPNGVSVKEYEDLPVCHKLEKDAFHIATVLRVVPIKDVKTMLLAFELVQEQLPKAQLAILGGFDESTEYYEECQELVRSLDIPNVRFYGRVKVKEYLPEIDLLLLSSISEGQPLAMLEGMAAGIPFVSTNVGDCKNLLEGREGDEFGRAGYIVPVMDSEAMAQAILKCARHPEQLKKMGETGKKRVTLYYREEDYLEQYRLLYEKLGGEADGRNRI